MLFSLVLHSKYGKTRTQQPEEKIKAEKNQTTVKPFYSERQRGSPKSIY